MSPKLSNPPAMVLVGEKSEEGVAQDRYINNRGELVTELQTWSPSIQCLKMAPGGFEGFKFLRKKMDPRVTPSSVDVTDTISAYYAACVQQSSHCALCPITGPDTACHVQSFTGPREH